MGKYYGKISWENNKEHQKKTLDKVFFLLKKSYFPGPSKACQIDGVCW